MPEHRTLLIVDDDPDDRDLIREALLEIQPDLPVLEAESGGECITILHHLTIEKNHLLLIIDFNLFDMSGADLLKKIALEPGFKEIIKIIWSTSDLEQFRSQCLEQGVQCYLKKPNTYPEILEIGRLILEKWGTK